MSLLTLFVTPAGSASALGDGLLILDDNGDQKLDANGDEVLGQDTDCAVCTCSASPLPCYYPLTKCSDGTAATVWWQSGTDGGTGVCPGTSDDLYFELDASATCYKYTANTAGTTDVHTVIGPNSAIDSCAHCGSFGPCNCTKPGGEVCKIKNLKVQVVGTTIWPSCCPPSQMYEHAKSVTNALNGTYLLPHSGNGCAFDYYKSLGNWQFYRDYGTPDAEVMPEDAPSDCSGNETFDVPMTLHIPGNSLIGVGLQASGLLDTTSAVWGDRVLVFINVDGPGTGFPSTCAAQSTTYGPHDPAWNCGFAIDVTERSPHFTFGGGTIITTAILSCPSDPPP